MITMVTTSTELLLTAFVVSYLMAQNKKPNVIGETLLLPEAMKMCKVMHGGKCVGAIKNSSL